MEIGGIDITIPAKPGKNVVSIIVSKMKELWPIAHFQEHNSENTTSIDSAWVKDYALDEPSVEAYKQRGFFIYKDADAALAWTDDKPGDEYNNQMLYFLIDSKHSDEHYVTIVVDEEDGFINDLVKYFQNKFNEC